MTLAEALSLACTGGLGAAGITDVFRGTSVGTVAVEDTDGWTVCPRGCSREVRGGPAPASKEIASVLGFQLVSVNVRGSLVLQDGTGTGLPRLS